MIPRLTFGRTGHESSRTIFGAAALWSYSPDDASRALDLLLKYDINHIDTAADYGESEVNIGPWMQEHRQRFFLATKTSKRTYQEAKDDLHRSLDRLKTDHVDLWQMHYLVNPQQWETAMGAGGVLEAFIEAKEEGLSRFIGVTGHGLATPRMHMKSLDVYDFDSVLVPYNYVLMQNPDYAADFNALKDLCDQRGVAVQTIKALARGPLGDKQNKYTVWYDAIDGDSAIEHAVDWVLGNPDVFLNTAGDLTLLEKILAAANQTGERPSDAVMQADLESLGITPLFTGDEI
ncbi:MAG TPA: aldo/keto reductase [Anaerolineales bacterium]|nr:aldo/keto reductase [Anaerolineales bacterium]